MIRPFRQKQKIFFSNFKKGYIRPIKSILTLPQAPDSQPGLYCTKCLEYQKEVSVFGQGIRNEFLQTGESSLQIYHGQVTRI